MAEQNKLQISIALCTYNGEKYLREQLDCFANQTRLPDEVVISDDGSTDRTMEILEGWASEVSFPVKIRRNEKNLGYARNFQETILRCTGDIVFPSDQDDWWFPEKLEKMEEVFLEKPETTFVACGMQFSNSRLEPYSDEEMRWRNLTRPETAFAYGMVQTAIGCGMAFRSDLLKKVFPMPESWAHDMWLCCVLPFYGPTVFLKEDLIKHRNHEESVTFQNINMPWTYGRNVFYCFSIALFQAHRKMREDFLESLDRFPDGEYKNYCREFYAHQEKHFGNRLKIQAQVWNLPLILCELFSGRYFHHPQPFKSFAFDVKEGLLNLLGLNKKEAENE